MQTISVSPDIYNKAAGTRQLSKIRESVTPQKAVTTGVKKDSTGQVKPVLGYNSVKPKASQIADAFIKISSKAKEVLPETEQKVLTPAEKKKMISEGGNVSSVLQTLTNSSQQSVSEDLSFEVMKPLKDVFKTALKYIGVTPASDTPLITEQVYNEIVRKANKTGGSTFEYEYPDIRLANTHVNNADIAKDTIIDAVIGYVKNAKTKADAGQDLTKVEEIIVNGTDLVKANLVQTAKAEAAAGIGNSLLFDKKTQLIIAGVLVAIVGITFFAARS